MPGPLLLIGGIVGVVGVSVKIIDAALRYPAEQKGFAYYDERNYERALYYFNDAIRIGGSGVGHYYVGFMYEHGQGTTRNFLLSAKNYQLSIDNFIDSPQEKQRSKDSLDRVLNSTAIRPDDLNQIGVMYHDGNGVARDRIKAKTLYERAIAIDNNLAAAYRNLGVIYENGWSRCNCGCYHGGRDLVIAARYYQQALDRGDPSAQRDLDQVFNSVDIFEPDDYGGYRIKIEGITEAELNSVAIMYHNGDGVIRDFGKARTWYQKLPDSNIIKRKNLKKLEKDLTLDLSRQNPEAYVNRQDNFNDTPLHRAAKYKHLNTYARLRFFGAENTILNGESRTPDVYLSEDEITKTRILQDKISEFINLLEQSAPVILARQTFIENGRFPDNETKEQMFRDLYSIDVIGPLLDPLLDLAKLSVLGIHDLAKRAKFSNPDYDSDDDVEGVIGVQKLIIRLDARRATVDGITHERNAYGVYYQGGSAVYFGGSRNSREESRATMIHELTHFIAYELYQNECKPYGKDDIFNRDRFNDITNDLRQRQNILDPILQRAFGQNYEQHNQFAAELIVRVPQMLVLYQHEIPNGLDRLQAQAPELLNYYRNVFLTAVTTHTIQLEQRALRGWPKELFYQTRTTLHPTELIQRRSSQEENVDRLTPRSTVESTTRPQQNTSVSRSNVASLIQRFEGTVEESNRPTFRK